MSVCPLLAQILPGLSSSLGWNPPATTATTRALSNFLKQHLHPASLLQNHHSSPFPLSRRLWVTGHVTHQGLESRFSFHPATSLLCVPAMLLSSLNLGGLIVQTRLGRASPSNGSGRYWVTGDHRI